MALPTCPNCNLVATKAEAETGVCPWCNATLPQTESATFIADTNSPNADASTGHATTTSREFKPSMANIFAGIVIGLLMVFGGAWLTKSMIQQAIRQYKRAGIWSDNGAGAPAMLVILAL